MMMLLMSNEMNYDTDEVSEAEADSHGLSETDGDSSYATEINIGLDYISEANECTYNLSQTVSDANNVGEKR